jgi:hypothetical protein
METEIQIEEYNPQDIDILENIAKSSHYCFLKANTVRNNFQKANACSVSKEIINGKKYLKKFHQLFTKNVYQVYNIEDDVTVTHISHNQSPPKWVIQMMDKITLNPKWIYVHDFVLKIEGVNLNISRHSIGFTSEFTTQGLAFMDAYDAIRFLKKKNIPYLAIKSNFKKNHERFLSEFDKHAQLENGVVRFEENFIKEILGC